MGPLSSFSGRISKIRLRLGSIGRPSRPGRSWSGLRRRRHRLGGLSMRKSRS